jgi:hypothetical protein
MGNGNHEFDYRATEPAVLSPHQSIKTSLLFRTQICSDSTSFTLSPSTTLDFSVLTSMILFPESSHI